MQDENNYPDSFTRRYPGLFWLLQMTSFSKWETFPDGKEFNAKVVREGKTVFLYRNRVKEIEDMTRQLNGENTEIVYLYGLGLGYHVLALFDWLEKFPRKAIVIFEDDMGIIEIFSKMPWAEKILSHPRIHLRKAPGEVEMIELAKEFPADKIQVFPLLSSIKGNFQKFELLLKRQVMADHAAFVENLYPQRLFSNLLINFLRIRDSFLVNGWKDQFQGKPAIICGAGPSLTESIPILQTLQNKALIIAGGSTIAALSNQGLIPHLGMALDPNQDEYIRLKNSTAFQTPLLYGNRLLTTVFTTTNSPPGYLASHTGGPLEVWFEKTLGLDGSIIGDGLGREAFSVTTLALSLAQFLGCNPIVFCGVDLGFTGNKSYAEGVLLEEKAKTTNEEKKEEGNIIVKDRNGKKITTLLKWIMEASSLGGFAKAHTNIQFYNCTEGGMPIPGIDYCSLQEVAEKDMQHTFDFSGYLHLMQEQHGLGFIKKSQISSSLEDFIKSLKRCLSRCEKIIQILEEDQKKETGPFDNGLVFIHEEDIKEELAYQNFLYTIMPSVTLWMNRFYLDPACKDYRYHYIDRKKTVWNVCRSAIEETLSLTDQVVFSEFVAQSAHTNP